MSDSGSVPPALGTALSGAALRPKPLLRGVSHELGAIAMLVIGPLIGLEARGFTAELCTSVYAFCVTAMLSVSALFHRVTWSAQGRLWMRRFDHCAIFLAIAGTYTAIAGLALPGADAPIVVGAVWLGAIAGIVFRLSWLDAPKWIVALPFLALGWVAAAVMPEMLHALGGLGFSLVLAGGLLYTLGAVVYARKRPDPWPKVFGYHEIFHACVLAALTLHLSVVAFFVLPALSHS
jgi:hemolysin III